MKKNDAKKMLIKTIIWYLAGSAIWFVVFGFLAATTKLQIQIIVSYVTLTAGLFIGFTMKEIFLKRPWLAVFIPILHIIAGMF
jgi:hypothetical protein